MLTFCIHALDQIPTDDASSFNDFLFLITATVTSSKSYIDCIYALAQTAQSCKGATAELGEIIIM